MDTPSRKRQRREVETPPKELELVGAGEAKPWWCCWWGSWGCWAGDVWVVGWWLLVLCLLAACWAVPLVGLLVVCFVCVCVVFVCVCCVCVCCLCFCFVCVCPAVPPSPSWGCLPLAGPTSWRWT